MFFFHAAKAQNATLNKTSPICERLFDQTDKVYNEEFVSKGSWNCRLTTEVTLQDVACFAANFLPWHICLLSEGFPITKGISLLRDFCSQF